MACFYPKCKNNDFSQASGRLDACIMWLWKSESGRRLDIRPSGHEKIERAEEEEEKKKERRRAEEVFLFPDVKERRAPNSDRQVSVVSVRKNTEAVRDDEQDHLSALFMIAALHNEKLLPPPHPSLPPPTASILPSINSRVITSFSACTAQYLRDASDWVSIASSSSSSSGRAGEQRQEAGGGTRGTPFV